MHSLHKFLPKCSEVSAPLRPLFSQNNEFDRTPDCENAFQQLKSIVKNTVELKHFDINRETRIVCDASHSIPLVNNDSSRKIRAYETFFS